MKKRLYRSESNRVLAGVCGGLGEYLGIDPIFIRIFFVLWTVVGELGGLAYFILWIVIPNQSAVDDEETLTRENLGSRFRLFGNEVGRIARQPGAELITYAGVGLILWGVYYLLQRLGFVWFDWNLRFYAWPALLILAGVVVLVRALGQRK